MCSLNILINKQIYYLLYKIHMLELKRINVYFLFLGPRRTITEDGLYIRNLKPSDAGNYTCRAFVVTPYNSQIKDKHITVHVHCTVRLDIDVFTSDCCA